MRSSAKPPASLMGNPQQVLRWGFTPNPPPRVAAREYYFLPSHWVSKTLPDDGLVESFEDGIYKVRYPGKCDELFHYELMSRISEARQAKHSRYGSACSSGSRRIGALGRQPRTNGLGLVRPVFLDLMACNFVR